MSAARSPAITGRRGGAATATASRRGADAPGAALAGAPVTTRTAVAAAATSPATAAVRAAGAARVPPRAAVRTAGDTCIGVILPFWFRRLGVASCRERTLPSSASQALGGDHRPAPVPAHADNDAQRPA